MASIIQQGGRILINDKENDNDKVNINDGAIIQYSGIYYNIDKIKTDFIGMVQTSKERHNEGIMGIYVKPLYIWDKFNVQWYKIINLSPPSYKYFLYPHFLAVEGVYCSHYPIFTLHTCKNRSLDEFADITKTFTL